MTDKKREIFAGVKMVQLPPSAALEFWPELEPFVANALEYDYMRSVTIEEVKHQVGEGYARVLIATDGERVLSATVIQIYMDKQERRTLHIIATAGQDADSWLEVMFAECGRLAVEQDCKGGITAIGRKGWARKLKPHGFSVEQVSMRKPYEFIREITEQIQQPKPEHVEQRNIH